MDEVKNAVRYILSKIPKKLIFDSHFVIDQLILKQTDAYYRIVRELANADAAQVHMRIALIVKEQTDLVKSVGKSYSLHIHGKGGKCEAWQRI